MASPVGSPPRCCPIWARRPSAIATSRWRRRRSTTRARSAERPCPRTASTARASARSSTARPRPPLSALAGRDRPASPHRLTVPPPGACRVTFGKAPTSARRLLGGAASHAVGRVSAPRRAIPRSVGPLRAPSTRSALRRSVGRLSTLRSLAPHHVASRQACLVSSRPVLSVCLVSLRSVATSCLVFSRPVVSVCLVSSRSVATSCLVSSRPAATSCLVSSRSVATSCLVSSRPAATSCVAAVAETAEAFERRIVSFGCRRRWRTFSDSLVLPGPALFSWFELFQAVYSRWTIPDGIVHLEYRKREKNVPVADRTMGAVTI